jgi:nucleoid-associated protein YejK
MGAVSNLRIESVILHILDRDGQRKVLSERPLPPGSDGRIFDLFKTHIEKSLLDEQSQTAQFKDADAPTAAACRKILEAAAQGEEQAAAELVAGSKVLAETLYDIMVRKPRVSRGDLVVCVYRAEEEGLDGRFLAVLKIDPVQAFLLVPREDEQGRRYVDVEVNTEAVPSAKEKLQKCAFVRGDERNEMILLDLQRRIDDKEVAQFFSGDFLGAKVVVDSRLATRRLARLFVDLENDLQATGQWGEEIKTKVGNALGADTVHLTRKWVDDLGLPGEQGDKVERKLKDKELLDKVVTIDRGYVEAQGRKKTRYEGDFGLVVEAWQSDFDRIVKPKPLKKGQKEREVVIRTHTWKRVS